MKCHLSCKLLFQGIEAAFFSARSQLHYHRRIDGYLQQVQGAAEAVESQQDRFREYNIDFFHLLLYFLCIQ